MAAAGINASTAEWCYRASEYRMRAGLVAGYQRLDRLAGAVRFVWNCLLGDSSTLRQSSRKPRTSARHFTRSALRNVSEFAWLQDHNSNIVGKTVAERLAKGLEAFHRNKKTAAAQGKPLKDKKGRLKWFKSKHVREYSFDLHPGQFRMQDGCLRIQKLGWVT
ncbi:MAG: hypothetical protein OXU68_15390, partial [Bacteroidota bacterium]|nr:hypothetical protein [Bacteroidota bacterium]